MFQGCAAAQHELHEVTSTEVLTVCFSFRPSPHSFIQLRKQEKSADCHRYQLISDRKGNWMELREWRTLPIITTTVTDFLFSLSMSMVDPKQFAAVIMENHSSSWLALVLLKANDRWWSLIRIRHWKWCAVHLHYDLLADCSNSGYWLVIWHDRSHRYYYSKFPPEDSHAQWRINYACA